MKNFSRYENFLLKIQKSIGRVPAWVTFILCIALTIVATHYAYQSYHSDQSARFDRLNRTLQTSIEQRFEVYIATLNHTRSLLDIDPDVTLKRFRQYVDGLKLDENYPGIRGIGYTPKVLTKDVEAFENKVSERDFPNYKIFPLDMDNTEDVHYPVAFFEPLDEIAQKAMGFDTYSEPNRRAAMDIARDTGKASATGRLEFMRGSDNERKQGFIIYLPYYKPGAKLETIEDRREALLGFVYSTYRSELFFNFLALLHRDRQNQVHIEIYEGSKAENAELSPEKLIFNTDNTTQISTRSYSEIFVRYSEIDVGNLKWTIKFTSLPDFAYPGSWRFPIYTLIFGSIISALITLSLILSKNQTRMLVKDIRLRQKAEHDLEDEKRIVELTSKIGLNLKAESDLKDIVQMVTDTATQLSGAKFGAFFYTTVNDEGEILTLYTLSGAPPEAFSKFPMPRKTEIFGHTFSGAGIIRSDDITKDPRYGKASPYHGMPQGHLPVKSYLAVPVKSNKTGEVLGALFFGHPEAGVFTDRSEQMVESISAQASVAMDNAKLYSNLREAQEAAEEASKAKSNFLANMSHEIRTPLGIILGYADLALEQQKHFPDNLPEYLTSIKKNGEELTRIIGEVLDLSKIEANRMEIEKIKFNLRNFLDDVISFLNLNAKEKGILLSLNKDANLPEEILSDPTRLRQILTNLVGNAIKFTEKGSITVSVRLSETSGQDIRLSFAIEDTGIGISTEQKQKLFKPFSQADNSTTRKYGGSGLGLLLSKQLSRAMGGDLVLEKSEPMKGSRFEFTIKACSAPVGEFIKTDWTKSAENKSPERKLINLNDKKILVVEDSADNQFLIKHYLKILNAQVSMANNGKEALDLISAVNPDLILMDIQMPVMDGYSTTSELRKSGFKKPIIALTAHALNEEKERALKSGFDDYLTKPLDKNLLIKTMQKFLAPA